MVMRKQLRGLPMTTFIVMNVIIGPILLVNVKEELVTLEISHSFVMNVTWFRFSWHCDLDQNGV
jgi:hypothetical protein